MFLFSLLYFYFFTDFETGLAEIYKTNETCPMQLDQLEQAAIKLG